MAPCPINDLITRANTLKMAAEQVGLTEATEVMTLLDVLTWWPIRVAGTAGRVGPRRRPAAGRARGAARPE